MRPVPVETCCRTGESGSTSTIPADRAASDQPKQGAPCPAIGIRASAVVVMVEPEEIVVRAAVAGHRPPHCWWDDEMGEVRGGERTSGWWTQIIVFGATRSADSVPGGRPGAAALL